MFLTAFIFLAIALLACPVGFGEDGIALSQALERDSNVISSPSIIIGTAAAEIPLLHCADSDIVITDLYAVVSVVGGSTGAAGSFTVGHTNGAASPTADVDSICGATTVSHVTATAPISSKIACTLLTTLHPTIGTDNYNKYGPRPIVAAGNTVIITTTAGASGVTQYRVVMHFKRIGKTS